MGEKGNIQYFTHKEIDKKKWDACIDNATNSLVYAYSFYLDHMSKHWHALVLNDYEIVMPLTWKKKYRIPYLYQPFFTAQLGVMGTSITSKIVDDFLKAIPARFKFIDIDLHENNTTNLFSSFINKRANMLVQPVHDYSMIHNKYHRLTTRMIRKATDENINIELNADIDSSISFYKEHYNHTLKYNDAVYNKISAAFKNASERNMLLSLVAKKKDELLAIYILLHDRHFVYSVFGGSSPQGKDKGAFYLLTDYAIKIASETNRVFRFEGSDIAGIAEFNLRFGATAMEYNHIKINRLPAILKWLKR